MRLAPTRRRVAALLLTAILSITGFSAVQPASAQDGVSVTIAPTGTGIATPGQAFSVTFSIKNTSKNPVPAGKAVLTARASVLNTVASLDDWLSGADGDTQPGWLLSNVTTPEVAPGQTLTQTADVDLAKAFFGQTWGPRGLSVDLIAGGNSVAHGRGALLWNAGTAPTPVQSTVILPIVALSSSSSTLGATELAELTSATGSLTRQLALASGRSVTLAVDPRILVSIAALGSGAPESAQSWLARLKALPNESFLLAYGDADLAGQLQAGATQPLNPGTSDLATAAARVAAAAAATPAPTASANAAPAPAPASLSLSFAPTLTGIGWPAAQSVISANVATLARAGYSSLLLASGNIDTGNRRPASVNVSGSPAVVTNDGFTAALADSASASRVLAYEGAAALDSSTSGRIVGNLPRTALTETTSSQAVAALDALSGQSWITPSALAPLITAAATSAKILDRPESTERVTQITALQGRLGEVGVFSSVTGDPSLITNPATRALATTLSVSWLEQGNWSRGIEGYYASSGKTLGAVEVVTSSDINMVGGQANIPVAVHNALTEPVTVRVQAKASNGRIAVTGDTTVTIQPDSQGKALIPVEARVSTGSALLEVTLFSNSGAQIGQPTSIPINVRADWEAWGLGAFALAFVVLVSAGIVRTLRRRRSRIEE